MKPIYIVLCYDSPIGVFYGDESSAFILAKTQGEAADEHGEYDPISIHKVAQQGEVSMNNSDAFMMWEDGKMIINPFKKL